MTDVVPQFTATIEQQEHVAISITALSVLKKDKCFPSYEPPKFRGKSHISSSILWYRSPGSGFRCLLWSSMMYQKKRSDGESEDFILWRKPCVLCEASHHGLRSCHRALMLHLWWRLKSTAIAHEWRLTITKDMLRMMLMRVEVSFHATNFLLFGRKCEICAIFVRCMLMYDVIWLCMHLI